MSSNRHQRKQELIESLAVSRLEILDETENVGRKFDHALSFSGKFGFLVKNHPVASSGAAVLGGLALVKLLSSLFHSSRHHHDAGAREAGNRGIIKLVGGSLWGMLLASATPVVKDWVQGVVKRKLHRMFPEKK